MVPSSFVPSTTDLGKPRSSIKSLEASALISNLDKNELSLYFSWNFISFSKRSFTYEFKFLAVFFSLNKYVFLGVLVINAYTPQAIPSTSNNPTTIGKMILSFFDISYPPKICYNPPIRIELFNKSD